MVDVLFTIGDILCILALVGFVGVVIFLVTTALKLKTSVVDNAGRLYKRPLAAGKNLAVTVKGIAQQETVRGKHIAGSAKAAALSVKDAAVHIKDAAQTLHPGELKPALSYVSNVSNALKVAVKLSQAGARQRTSE